MMGNICQKMTESNRVEPNMQQTEMESYYTIDEYSRLYAERDRLITTPKIETKIPFQNQENSERIMKILEDEGTQIAINTLNDSKSTPAETVGTLISFMSDGAKRFEKETGRQMTYAEMRAMWG